MRTIYLDTKDPFILGKTGESNRTTLRVKVEQWYQEYPDGHGVILFMRPNKVVYPLETNLIEHDGEHYLEAIVTDNETKLAGYTVVTAQWYDGETLAHGLVFSGKVLTSAGNGPIDGVKETTPTWVSTLIAELATINETAATVQEAYEKMEEAVSKIDEALNTAEETVAQAQDAAETAQTAKTNAQESAAAAAVSATQAMSTTPEGYNAMVASLARVFDPEAAYSAGEYVNQNSTIYRFTSDHAAGDWTGTDAVAVKMADDLGDLKSAINNTDKAVIGILGTSIFDQTVKAKIEGSYVNAYLFDSLNLKSGVTYTFRITLDVAQNSVVYITLADSSNTQLKASNIQAGNTTADFTYTPSQNYNGTKLFVSGGASTIGAIVTGTISSNETDNIEKIFTNAERSDTTLSNILSSQSIYSFTVYAKLLLNNTRIKTFPVFLRKGSIIDLSTLNNIQTYINGYSTQKTAYESYDLGNSVTNGDIVYTYPYRDLPTYTIKQDGWYMVVAKNADDSAFSDTSIANNIFIKTELQLEATLFSDFNATGYWEINGYTNGSFGNNGTLSYGQSNRLRIGDFYFFKSGTTVKINSGTCSYVVGMWKNSLSAENTIRNDSTFRTGEEKIKFEYDSYIIVAFAKQNTSEAISKSDLDGYVRVYPFVAEQIEDTQEDIQGLETSISGIESQISSVGGSFSQSDAFTIKESLPSYYSVLSGGSYSGYDVGYLESKIKTIPDGKHFIVRTDTHVPDNAKKSTKIIEYIRRRCGITKVVDLGDWINRGETNVLGWAQCADYVQESVETFGREFDVAIGNHDLNSASISASDQAMVIPYDIAHNLFQGHLDGFVTYPSTSQIPAVIDTLATGDDLKSLKGLYKTFYYRDDAKNKIRYIVLYSGADYTVTYTYLNVMGNEVLCTQFDWLYDTLMSVPTGYDVVVFVHQMSGSYHYIQPIQQGCMKILSHFKTKTTYDLNYDWNDSPVYAQGIHSYNFANAPTVGKVLCCAGHIHYDQMLYVSASAYGVIDGACDNTNGVIPIITTLTDSYGMHDYERNSEVYIEHLEPYYEMTSGTVTEQVVDVYTLNDSGIYITRFGAGVDRYLQML